MNNAFTQLEAEKIVTFVPTQWGVLRNPDFYNFSAQNYNYLFPREIRLKRAEIMEREILTNMLIEAIKADWNQIKDEVKELLKDYEVPIEFTEQVISEVKKKVKSKLQGLPDEDWLTEILSKLYIRITYKMLHV
jgi:signal recognition particle GTPase